MELPNGLELHMVEDHLTLTDGVLSMSGDYTSMLVRLKHNNLTHELLVKAAKLKNADGPLTVLDATAGMGEDSLLLAAAGFEVYLYEQDPVIAALLSDTVRRGLEDAQLHDSVARMHVMEGDSIAAMRQISETGIPQVDVIYLDPMFPAREKSGLIKKKFQLLQQLERPCAEEKELLEAAISAHPKRIVIKRPAKGPYLAGVKPSYSLDGKAIRYDCIVL